MVADPPAMVWNRPSVFWRVALLSMMWRVTSLAIMGRGNCSGRNPALGILTAMLVSQIFSSPRCLKMLISTVDRPPRLKAGIWIFDSSSVIRLAVSGVVGWVRSFCSSADRSRFWRGVWRRLRAWSSRYLVLLRSVSKSSS